MAKIDSQASRVTVFADDDSHEPLDQRDQVYRSAPPLPSRARSSQDISTERKAPRKLADQADRDAGSGEDAFLRTRTRVPVRRGLMPVSRTGRIAAASALVCVLALMVLSAIGIRNFFRHDSRFRIASSSSIQILGNAQVTRPELLSVFGSDMGRNIFFIPLAERRAALERLPWVEHATVMRLLPDQLRVAIVERTPVAFVRQGSSIGLVDAHGVFLHLPPAVMAARHYSFPVVTGIFATDLPTVRAARMHLYQQFVGDLDSGGAKVSPQLSEVDLSDLEDVWALLPAQGTDIQVHFGDSDFLARYRSYQQHLPEWRQQYPHLASVDMRYENQVVLDMNQKATAQAPSQGTTPATAGVVQHPTPHPSPAAKHTVHPPTRSAAKSPRSTKARG